MYSLDDRSTRHRLDECRCATGLHLRGLLGIDLVLDLDLLLDDAGAGAGPPVDDSDSEFSTSADAEL